MDIQLLLEQLDARLISLQTEIRDIRRELIGCGDRERDLIALLLRTMHPRETRALFTSSHPIAQDSADHRFPRGTRKDNTRHPRFPYACEKIFRRKIRHLDLGCAGGGLVWDFIIAGHESYGIEGSDYSLRNQRAEWRVIPDNLFTGDITKPFSFRDFTGQILTFDVITAWEVLEHIPEAELTSLLTNISSLLSSEGFFVASVATFPDEDSKIGAIWHATVRPKTWWEELLRNNQFILDDTVFDVADFARGTGNPRSEDWDVLTNPDFGFHVVCRKASGSPLSLTSLPVAGIVEFVEDCA